MHNVVIKSKFCDLPVAQLHYYADSWDCARSSTRLGWLYLEHPQIDEKIELQTLGCHFEENKWKAVKRNVKDAKINYFIYSRAFLLWRLIRRFKSWEDVGVNESWNAQALGRRNTKRHIPTSAPFPAFRCTSSLFAQVARALVQTSRAACLRDCVDHTSTCHRINKCRLFAPWNVTLTHVSF